MKHLLVIPVCVLLIACGGGSNSSSRPDPVTMPPVATLQDRLQGVWEQSGYGRVFRIAGSTVETFDITTQTCVLAGTEVSDDFSGITLSEDETAFTTRDTEISFEERYSKIDELPGVCEQLSGDAPGEIYDHTWHTFNEYYAFFNEREVDWLVQRDATRDRVHEDLSEAELFDVLSMLLAPLDDEHVFLTSESLYFNPAQPKGFLLQLISDFEQQSETGDLSDYIGLQLHQWDANIRSLYLDGDVESAADDTFIWGTIGDEIGYLRIDAMIFSLDEAIEDQVAEAETLLDQVFTDLADTNSLIVDIRLNGGGTDAISFAIARRFADSERLSVSKFTRTLSGDGASQSIHIGPIDRPSYLNPVVLITSGFSTSAAEVFTLAMRAWPQVTHIGEATNGSISDVLEKPLPNGWTVELANEVYLDSEGKSHEATGIPPHLEVPVFRMEERNAGQDSAINAALELLGFSQ